MLSMKMKTEEKSTQLKMTGETPEVRSDKRKPREDRPYLIFVISFTRAGFSESNFYIQKYLKIPQKE